MVKSLPDSMLRFWFSRSFLRVAMGIGLTKKDVAKRQLITAIELLFSHADIVSVVSLAANGWEIIDYFCRTDAVVSMSSQARSYLLEGKRLKVHYINSPYRNFFKHAENDADVILPSLEPAFVDGLIYLAVEDYLRWAKKGPIEFQVFQLWYLAVYIEKVADEDLARVLEGVESEFKNIRTLARQDQIEMGSRVLSQAKQNVDLLSDPQTEA